jgi:hypothetical protein
MRTTTIVCALAALPIFGCLARAQDFDYAPYLRRAREYHELGRQAREDAARIRARLDAIDLGKLRTNAKQAAEMASHAQDTVTTHQQNWEIAMQEGWLEDAEALSFAIDDARATADIACLRSRRADMNLAYAAQVPVAERMRLASEATSLDRKAAAYEQNAAAADRLLSISRLEAASTELKEDQAVKTEAASTPVGKREVKR